MLNKVDKRGPLHLHRLAMPVVERQDKVEKVGLAEVWGRLFLKMSPGERNPTEDAERKRRSASASKAFQDFYFNKRQLSIERKNEKRENWNIWKANIVLL